MMKKTILLGLLIASMPLANADQKSDVTKLEKMITKNFDGAKADRVSPTPVKGIYQAEFGTNVLYFSADGKYMISGNLVDAASKENLTDKARGKLVLKALKSIPETEMLVIGPKKAKHTLTVFTDVDCPYCAKFHKEVPDLNKAGVKVRYLLYPRAGLNSSAYKKMVSVWCSDDRASAITAAKEGKPIPEKTCDNPIKKHIALGDEVGLRGTPLIITDTGEVLPGYVPEKKLLAMLGVSTH